MHGFAELWTERAVTDSWQEEVWHAVDIEGSQDETAVMSHPLLATPSLGTRLVASQNPQNPLTTQSLSLWTSMVHSY